MNETHFDPSKLTEFVAEAIAYIIDTREKKNRPPFMATESNIKNVMAQCLDRALAGMVGEGVLTVHPGLNEKMYEFTPPKR